MRARGSIWGSPCPSIRMCRSRRSSRYSGRKASSGLWCCRPSVSARTAKRPPSSISMKLRLRKHASHASGSSFSSTDRPSGATTSRRYRAWRIRRSWPSAKAEATASSTRSTAIRVSTASFSNETASASKSRHRIYSPSTVRRAHARPVKASDACRGSTSVADRASARERRKGHRHRSQ